MILGIDIGGVIIDRSNDKADTSLFGPNYLKAQAVQDAFAVIARLRPKFDMTYLVSKCGYKTEMRTREWLEANNFYVRTGVELGNVLFCRERQQKAPICEDRGITHFIDDRLEVLGYLTSVKRRFLFRGSSHEIAKHETHLSSVVRVDSWLDLEDKLVRTL